MNFMTEQQKNSFSDVYDFSKGKEGCAKSIKQCILQNELTVMLAIMASHRTFFFTYPARYNLVPFKIIFLIVFTPFME